MEAKFWYYFYQTLLIIYVEKNSEQPNGVKQMDFDILEIWMFCLQD